MTLSGERIKHLEFIQSIISRQASNSFAIKGWSLTVATAIYAYTASHLAWWLAIIALLPACAFALLDVYYLRQERLFRELYNHAIDLDGGVPMFSMDTSRFCNGERYPRCRYQDVWKSSGCWPLHGMIVLVGLVLLGIAIF